jgi:hypothetical protein
MRRTTRGYQDSPEHEPIPSGRTPTSLPSAAAAGAAIRARGKRRELGITAALPAFGPRPPVAGRSQSRHHCGRLTRTHFVRLPANGQRSLPAISKGNGGWRQCDPLPRRASFLTGTRALVATTCWSRR